MQNKKYKAGILGGTFNPIHNAHIALGKAAYQQFSLDKILVMVSKTPPHKLNTNIPDAAVRSEMVKLAVAEYDFMEYSDFELQRSGYIYTSDTLTLLTEQNPETEYYFILGGDSLENIRNWHKPEIILQKAVILASGRNSFQGKKLDNQILCLKQIFPQADIRKVILEDISYSSTEIRNAVQQGRDISSMVDKKVYNYIKEHKLYSDSI